MQTATIMFNGRSASRLSKKKQVKIIWIYFFHGCYLFKIFPANSKINIKILSYTRLIFGDSPFTDVFAGYFPGMVKRTFFYIAVFAKRDGFGNKLQYLPDILRFMYVDAVSFRKRKANTLLNSLLPNLHGLFDMPER